MKNVVCIEHFKCWTFHSNELIKKSRVGSIIGRKIEKKEKIRSGVARSKVRTPMSSGGSR